MAAATLDRALTLCRGPALAEFADRPFAAGHARRIERMVHAARRGPGRRSARTGPARRVVGADRATRRGGTTERTASGPVDDRCSTDAGGRRMRSRHTNTHAVPSSRHSVSSPVPNCVASSPTSSDSRSRMPHRSRAASSPFSSPTSKARFACGSARPMPWPTPSRATTKSSATWSAATMACSARPAARATARFRCSSARPTRCKPRSRFNAHSSRRRGRNPCTCRCAHPFTPAKPSYATPTTTDRQ